MNLLIVSYLITFIENRAEANNIIQLKEQNI